MPRILLEWTKTNEIFDNLGNKKKYNREEIEQKEIELLRYLSHWIYTKLKLYGQITQNDIDVEFDEYSSPVMYDSLKALEEVGIIFSDTVFNQELNRTEIMFYAKKPMV